MVGLGIETILALADIDPVKVDTSVDFSSIGGHDDYIKSLKEMILLPLLYPEIFQQFHIIPPVRVPPLDLIVS